MLALSVIGEAVLHNACSSQHTPRGRRLPGINFQYLLSLIYPWLFYTQIKYLKEPLMWDSHLQTECKKDTSLHEQFLLGVTKKRPKNLNLADSV